jgi:tetratricopeptide (TPR) repeat protein
MRVFTWKVARQMAADHWLTGVGADNFGHAFNRERIRFRETHPNDTTVEIAEDYLVERAHNEPIQILSELGVIGSLLIFLPFMLFLTWLAKSFVRTRRFSPVMWAALSGMAAFLVSSMFSSFSFRAAQNGVAFFMVFAVAVTNMPRAGVQTKRRNFGSGFSRPVHLFAWVITILMAVFCLTKIFAEYQVYKAERAEFYQEAVDHLQLAVAADAEYAGAYMSNSGIAAKEGDHGSAAKSMRKAIDNGIATTPIYSQLAKQQVAAGNFEQAEATYREALAIYPRSIFLRIEFAVFLEDHGKPDAAAEQAKIARSIDLRQANGWYSIIREDSITAFYRSQKEPDLAPPAELLPPTAVLQYIGKMPGS